MTATLAPDGTRQDLPARSPSVIVAVLAFAGIVVALMQSLVIPIVPELPTLLHADAADTAWAITATLLASAVAVPIVGRLGDMFGKRKMLILSLVVLVAGSVLGALADTLAVLIVARALQGLASGVIPLGISIMRDELPPEKLGSAVALMSASLGIGGALGLPAAALIADNFSWHVLFWTSAVAGVVALVGVLTLVPAADLKSGGRFDAVGAVGLSVGLFSMLLAISKGGTWGWASGRTLGFAALALVALVLWAVWELRTTDPLVDLRTTVRRQVLLTNLASIMLGFAMFGLSLVVPQIIQVPEATGYGFGGSMLEVGLVMAPSGIVMMLIAPVSAKVSRLYGPKVSLMAGALVVGLGYLFTVFFMSEVWHFVAAAVITGVGVGMAYGAMPALIMSAVPVTETAAANALNTLMRSIGTSVSSAVAGVVLAQMTLDLGGHVVPSEDGLRLVLALGALAAFVAFAIAAFLPRRQAGEMLPAVH
ncbi:MFS transporter [Mumia zhuanghuii]|uniref:MFS transporter n=2 Tax=Mumia TaxID=1546255 RepID=A0ABW1QI09_9ACTN|nr:MULTISPECIES: MFS transporter [Mumia]KAA1418325.1 MFS transporter [Mumia zhuanghuii]